MNTIIEILGYMAAICIPLAFLPQTIKIIKTKKTSGLSLFSYTTYQIGGIIFLIFGILKDDIAIITCQTITASLNFIIISVIISNLIKIHQQNKEQQNGK